MVPHPDNWLFLAPIAYNCQKVAPPQIPITADFASQMVITSYFPPDTNNRLRPPSPQYM